MSELTTTPAQGNVQMSKRRRRDVLQFIAKYGTLVGMLLMIVIFSILRPDAFFRVNNFVNIVNQAALTAIISAGLTVALIVDEMDLSIASVASFAGVLVTGLIVDTGFPILLALLAVLVVGGIIGLVNSLIVTQLRVNAVVATLGTGSVVVGLNFAYSQGVPIASGVPEAFKQIALGRTFGIPNNTLIMLFVLGVLWVIINRTELGQKIQAVGGNKEAARLSGIRVDQIKMVAFIIAGVAAALTGILLASLIGSGTSRAADNYLLNAFAASFLGSATLRDGEFHIVGTLIGVLIIGIGFNGLAIFGVPTFYQFVFQGAILILAVGMSSIARRLSQS